MYLWTKTYGGSIYHELLKTAHFNCWKPHTFIMNAKYLAFTIIKEDMCLFKPPMNISAPFPQYMFLCVAFREGLWNGIPLVWRGEENRGGQTASKGGNEGGNYRLVHYEGTPKIVVVYLVLLFNISRNSKLYNNNDNNMVIKWW